jgi:hypothetical protein
LDKKLRIKMIIQKTLKDKWLLYIPRDGGLFRQFGPEKYCHATKMQGLAVELYLDTTLFVDQRNHFGPGSVVSFLGADLPSLQEIFMRAVGKHEHGNGGFDESYERVGLNPSC